jgi:hypothetical protein
MYDRPVDGHGMQSARDESFRSNRKEDVMVMGHYAPAFAIKGVEKTIPLWLLFLSVQLLDIVWAFLTLVGIEKVRIVPGITEANALDLYYFPFSHGLPAALVWSGIAFAVCMIFPTFRRAPRAALLVGAGVLAHWFLDLLVHRPDLPLFGDTLKVGLGLWNYLIPSLIVEAGITLAGVLLYMKSTTGKSWGGRYGMLIFFVVMLLFQINASFGPPPPSPRQLAIAMLVFYFGATAIVFWLERKRY